jgi:hypothetical protein
MAVPSTPNPYHGDEDYLLKCENASKQRHVNFNALTKERLCEDPVREKEVGKSEPSKIWSTLTREQKMQLLYRQQDVSNHKFFKDR